MKIYLIDPYEDYTCGTNEGRNLITKEDLSMPKKRSHKILAKYNISNMAMTLFRCREGYNNIVMKKYIKYMNYVIKRS